MTKLSLVFRVRKRISSGECCSFLRVEGGPKFSFFRCERVEVQILIGEEFVVELQYIRFESSSALLLTVLINSRHLWSVCLMAWIQIAACGAGAGVGAKMSFCTDTDTGSVF